jgi:23S rRNA (guanosine2251-2'-O)-methyltransferase
LRQDRFNGAMTRRPLPNRSPEKSGLWLYGIHAVRAALGNPQRTCRRCVLTKAAADHIGDALLRGKDVQIVGADQVSRQLPPGAVHQGVALACNPLPHRDLREVVAREGRKIIVVLDQISDPQNVGAILRSAAAFEAAAVIVQDRHAPPESGALAKAASGALDLVPYLEVVNIARALEQLGDAGFWRVALGQDAGRSLVDAMAEGNIALVLGSEGAGIRQLVRTRCDETASIPIGARIESLNVSNAAAIALYECRRVKR